MDSQDSHEMTHSQHLSSDIEHINLSDSPVSQHAYNSSEFHPFTPMPQPNPFIQVDQFSNQFTPLNFQFQPNFPFNSKTDQFPSHVQQNFGAGFSFQGLMNAPNLQFENQTSNSSKGSKKVGKGKASKNFQTSQSTCLRRNWTSDEDIALTKAWLSISVDSIVGTNQKFDTMWNRILKVWRDNMGDQYDKNRNTNALGCRWGVIHAAVTKFHGLYEGLERHPRSGTNPDDWKREAMRMYKELNEGQSFKFEHCWEIMKKNPKWCSQFLTSGQVSKKQKTVDGSSIDAPAPTTPQSSFSHGDSINAESIISDGVVRPLGRKASKENKKNVHEEKVVVSFLTNIQCTLEKQLNVSQEELESKKEKDRKDYELREKALQMEMEFKARNQKLKEEAAKRKGEAEKRKEQERILNQDLTKLQPILQVAFERMQAQILKEWENDGLFGEVAAGNDVDL